MYPEPQDCKVHPPAELAGVLEGQSRPGFFVGVATIVLKLFNIVQPRVAVFGKKDYQQFLVIKNMVRQFALPVQIVAAETVREPGGLALSSRNGYLRDDQRIEAVQLYRILCGAVAELKAGKSNREDIERAATESLEARGWQPTTSPSAADRTYGFPATGMNWLSWERRDWARRGSLTTLRSEGARRREEFEERCYLNDLT